MTDESDDQPVSELIRHYRNEAAEFRRRWTLTLGIGCGGGLVALISLAANLPDPNYAFQLFAPSLWILLAGVVASALSLPVAAFRSSSLGEHFAQAHNREMYHSAARKLPQVFSSPERIADEMNAPRNAYIEKGDQAHDKAEEAWRKRDLSNAILWGLTGLSALCFIVGAALPLINMSLGGEIVPTASR